MKHILQRRATYILTKKYIAYKAIWLHILVWSSDIRVYKYIYLP